MASGSRKVYPQRENNRPSLVPGHRRDAAIPAARKAAVTADVATVQAAGGGTAGTRVTATLYPDAATAPASSPARTRVVIGVREGDNAAARRRRAQPSGGSRRLGSP